MAKIDLYSQNWCDLIFEGKNKSYGAYVLRAETGQRNAKSLIALVIALIAAIFLPMLVKSVIPKASIETVTTTKMAKLEEAKVKDKNIIKKVEPKQAQPQRIKSSIKFTAPKIVKDDQVTKEDEMKSQKELGETKVAISIADVKGNDDVHGKDIADIKEVITSKADDEEAKVFSFVEQMPQFPGGEAALMKYIADHLRYPSSAQDQNIQGLVMLRFVVTGTGEVGDVQVLKSLDPDCDREAIRVVQSLPKFTPGRQQGKPVNVWFQLPIRFELR
ncbi:MAG: energy transducer TonB [Bacteroidaceae bacterium]|nr:energy transducer TonB [Bacteroidaceae bacterium]